MTEVNVSSYPSAQPQQDPLAMLGKVLQIQGAQQGLQMQQQEFKARQALGPILQQSIDPQTGELDINKFLVHGAANPDVAWKMPEITLQMIQRQNTQADTVIKQLEANKVRYGAMGDAAGALVSQGEEAAKTKVNVQTGLPGTPGVTSKQLASSLSTMVGENGLIDSKDAAEILAKTAGMNDSQRFQYLKTFAKSALGVKDTMEKTYGAVTGTNTGGGTTFTQADRFSGTNQKIGGTGGQLETTPTPAEMNATTPGITAQGRPTIRPRVEAAPMYGGSGQQIPGSGQGTPAGPGAPAPNITGLSPQETKLQEARAGSANTYEEELTNANTTGQENIRILREMQDALKAFKTGGGSEVRARIGGMLDALGIPKSVVDKAAGGDRGAIQEFQKLAVRYATAEMKSNMGSGQKFTNLDFDTFLKNNPTITTDARGLDKMFNFLERGVWRVGQQQEAHNQWKSGYRPRGFENSGMDAFPAWWTKTLTAAQTPEGKK